MGPQAMGAKYLGTTLRHLHAMHRASSCAKRGGHEQLCSKPRGPRRFEIEPSEENFSFLCNDRWTKHDDLFHAVKTYRAILRFGC